METKELVEQVLAGKEEAGGREAWEALYRRTYHRVYYACKCLLKNDADAEDLVQESYLAAMEHLEELREKDKFEAWILRLAVNRCKNFLKQQNRFRLYATEEEAEAIFHDGTEEQFLPAQYAEQKEKRQQLLKIMQKELSDALFETVILYYFDELTIQEVAEYMQCPEGTVKYRLSVARRRIRESILSQEEKKGEKLFLLAGVPFFALFFRQEVSAMEQEREIPPLRLQRLPAAEGAGSAAHTNILEKGRKFMEKSTKGSALIARKAGIVAGVCVLALAGIGIGIAVKHYNYNEEHYNEEHYNEEQSLSEEITDRTETVSEEDGIEGGSTAEGGTEESPFQGESTSADGTEENLSETAAEQYGVEIGSIITFGSYEQDNVPDNGPEPIEWYLLDVSEDGEALLLAVWVLDAKAYNDVETDVTWESSSLRQWLNRDFYNTAFTAEEQALIVDSYVENADSPAGVEGGNDTVDKLFLLSKNETDAYDELFGFGKWDAYVTEYAGWLEDYAQGIFYYKGKCNWWLRTPGESANKAMFVHSTGNVSTLYDTCYGQVVDFTIGVRPAVRIMISDLNF